MPSISALGIDRSSWVMEPGKRVSRGTDNELFKKQPKASVSSTPHCGSGCARMLIAFCGLFIVASEVARGRKRKATSHRC